MSWWTKLTGGRDVARAAPSAQQASPVPGRWRATLERVLAPFESVSPGLPALLRDYVLTGAPAEVLGRPELRTDAANVALGVGNPGFDGDGQAQRDLYADVHDVPAEVVLRWARLLEVPMPSWMKTLVPVAGGHWAEALVMSVRSCFDVNAAVRHPSSGPQLPVDIAVVENALLAAGADRHDLLVAAFQDPGGRIYPYNRIRHDLRRLVGYPAAVARAADAIRPVITGQGEGGQLVAADMLTPLPDTELRLFAAEIVGMVTSGGKQVRAAAAPLAARCGPALAAPLQEVAVTGGPEARLHAFRLLGSDTTTRPWALEHAAADRAPKVRALAEEWASEPGGEPALATAPRPAIDWHVPVTAEMRAELEALWAGSNAQSERYNAHNAARRAQFLAGNPGQLYGSKPAPLLDRGTLKDLFAALASDGPPTAPKTLVPGSVPTLLQQLSPVALGPVGLVVVLHQLGGLVAHDGSLSSAARALLEDEHGRSGHPTLLELATMLDELGLDGGRGVYWTFASSWGTPFGRHRPDAELAPFAAAHLDLVLASLSSTERGWRIDDDAPYRVLAALPELPRTAIDALFDTALAGNKVDRRPAQDALDGQVGTEARIIAALTDGRNDVRAEAARWLRRLRAEAAVPALEAAVVKEKQDVAKGAMLDALEAAGRPVERYVDRAALAAGARTAVARGLPKDLAWFPWASLPGARWADTGEAVGTETLQWLLAQAVRTKSPEPNAMLRKYCSMFVPADRERLGQFVLEAWIAEDTRPIDHADALARAQQEAQWTRQLMATYPQRYQNSPLLGASEEELIAAYLPKHLREPVGSAVGSKGVLAVVAACAGESAAAPVERYLKDWYGSRASQGRALITMLGWIEHPSATQLMLSVGSRFRTKSFQEEATRQAHALAERKGWTLEELADRTVPTAGLDSSGRLELSYGDRTFSAVLRPDLTLELRSPEDTKIAALPAARRTDDPDAVAASKKALTAARKELKAVVKLQTERLYESLCTGRTWAVEDWQRYLAGHPVLRLLVGRLVWTASTADGASIVFRRLDDGTLTDADDAEVTLAPDARVGLAHDTSLDAATVRRWEEHLDDYEVVALFQQFGRGGYVPPAASALEITDFRGHLLEAFALRGRATKLGYTRGVPEDGGWFYTYEKRFPTLGLSSVIEFSGNGLPEENRTVALTVLRFARHAEGREPAPLRLADVPEVLVSEAYADMRELAAAGTGHDPAWEKAVGR